MQNEPPIYHTYILCLWAERHPGDSSPRSWRFSLENPEENSRRGFANLNDLISYLQAEMD